MGVSANGAGSTASIHALCGPLERERRAGGPRDHREMLARSIYMRSEAPARLKSSGASEFFTASPRHPPYRSQPNIGCFDREGCRIVPKGGHPDRGGFRIVPKGGWLDRGGGRAVTGFKWRSVRWFHNYCKSRRVVSGALCAHARMGNAAVSNYM